MQSLGAVTTALFLCINIMKIEEYDLVNISITEAHKLNKEYGIPFCAYEGISRSKPRHGKHSHYYLCESRDGYNLKCLSAIRKAVK